MILLTNPQLLEIITSVTCTLHVTAYYADITVSGMSVSGLAAQDTIITTAATTTITAAPASGVVRQVKVLTFENAGTASVNITLKKDVSGTDYTLYTFTLAAGENVTYIDGKGFEKHDRSGNTTDSLATDRTVPIAATVYNALKVGAANEAAGIIHFLGLSSGNPGAWAVGTPGVNGRATDGTQSADAGCIPVKNPASGNNYLTNFIAALTTVGVPMLIDILWVNSGLVVTTTTEQAIAPVALPARDVNGSSNGEGVMAGILVTTATTNAGAVTNTTLNYTNSDGTAAKTATMSSFPATAAAGTIVPFQLATGDKGVRSPQGITLGTSYVTGAISLILYRVIAMAPGMIANGGGQLATTKEGNARLYNGSCLLPAYIPSGTTASTMTAIVNVEEK